MIEKFITYYKYENNDLNSNKIRLFLLSIFIVSFICFILSPNITILLIFILANSLTGLWLIFKSLVFLAGIYDNINSHFQGKPDLHLTNIEDLPIYSILIPLYREPNIIHQLVYSLNAISYPQALLDIIILIEEDDDLTLDAINKLDLDSKYRVIIVPNSLPRTKPKACNYGLQFVKGEYVTIYDAEDIPDVLQLQKVVEKFRKLNSEYICIQARLNFYNKNENLLSKLFSLEYSYWFDFMLPGLHKLGLVIPLGGTSNHFKTNALKQIGAWDAHNLTEDAELGLRISAYGYKTYLLDSYTLEESPLKISIWIKQRTRWIKGYIQTFAVFRKNIKFYKTNLSVKQITGIYLFVGMSCFVHFLKIIFLIIFCFQNFLDYDFLEQIEDICVISFFSYFIISFIITIITMVKSKIYDPCVILLMPVYSLIHSVAAIRSLYHLTIDDLSWEKTEHGFSIISKYENDTKT